MLMLMVTGSVARYKQSQIVEQRKLADEIFYTMRALEIDLIKLRVEAEQLKTMEAKKADRRGQRPKEKA